ncbi:MAG: DUF721 domain-containing protein [Rhodocyclaceae bacterium]|nr:DUF721 domain-containing protein [Rhodocyclaceae bacterium]
MAAPLDRYLEHSDTLAALHVHAARLARIDALFRRSLPPHLAGACAVANLRAGSLVVHAESGAAAAKLRQAVPSLLEGLAIAGVVVERITVKVRPPRRSAPRPPVTRRSVPPSAHRAIDTLADSLPADSPLCVALRRLITRSA